MQQKTSWFTLPSRCLTIVGVLVIILWNGVNPAVVDGQTATNATATAATPLTTPITTSPISIVNEGEITQSTIGLMAIPPRLGDDGSLTAHPGEIIQTSVRVRNTSQALQTVQTVVEDFIIDIDGKTPLAVTEAVNSRWSLKDWMQWPTGPVTLPPGAAHTIPVVIHVPANALPGGHYAMIMHQPLSGAAGTLAAELGGQATINQRVGTLVYVKVAGEITESAHLRQINIPSFSEFGPVPITFAIENLSDIHIRPSTTITIHNWWGQNVDTITVEAANIFPQTLREFKTQWDRVWGFGRYRAEFATSYGAAGQVATSSHYFWVIPYKLLMAIVLLVLSLVAVIVAVRRHLINRQDVAQDHIKLLEDRIRQLEDELHTRE